MIKLVLFDIDGTLVLTGGAGARAMTRAFEETFQTSVKTTSSGIADVPFAGRTDTWIVSEMARLYGGTVDGDSLARFHDTYVQYLTREIQRPGPRKGVLPGVTRVLEALAGRHDVHLALLTGNFAAGARVKLQHFDLWRYFPCGAFAEDAPDRNGLLAHALARVEACSGLSLQPADAVVVGDTPFDVGVAQAGGARSLAVATGSFSADALRTSGADETLDDLSDLGAVLRGLGVSRE